MNATQQRGWHTAIPAQKKVRKPINQLIRENNQAAGKTWKWSYDNAGNILSKTEYAYTTGTLGTALDTVNYTYGDSAWGDLLTAYDGVAIQRDGIGNPTSDGTWNYTWEHGRQLYAMSYGNQDIWFAYDANGLRTTKTVRTIVELSDSQRITTAVHDYVYTGSKLTQYTVTTTVATYPLEYVPFEPAVANAVASTYAVTDIITTTRTLYFTYDASGKPAAVSYTDNSGNTVEYYYMTNLQGDVVAILNSTGTAVVQYTYDAWGKLLSTTGTMASTLGTYNPLRYRSYVYDAELGLYYLQSRYYNPTLGRFLNADALVSTGQGVLGNNMFAYCRNNPIVQEDATGTADRACIYAEGRMDEEPWRDHSPGGGGIPRRNYSSSSNYYGEVADKFYTVKLLRVVGKGLGIGAKWLWDAYMREYNLQQEAQLQQAIVTRDFIVDRFSTPEKARNTLNGMGIAIEGVSIYVGVVCGPIPGAITAGVGVFFTAIAWGIDVLNEE